jgi:hypothetical protein
MGYCFASRPGAMPNFAQYLSFAAAMVIICVVWGRVLWFFSERFSGFNSCVFFVMNFTRREYHEVKSILLSAIYYLVGLVMALAVWGMFGLHRPIGFGIAPEHIPLIALGIVGQVSLSNLLVSLYCAISSKTSFDSFAEIKNIPWIAGVRNLPSGSAPVAAALGGVVEELFFRGVVLQIMIQVLAMPPYFAIAAAGALFLVQQLLQVQTFFQAVLIGAGCVAISLVGGLLVVISQSVTPALLCHASFLVFFIDPLGPQHDRSTAGR